MSSFLSRSTAKIIPSSILRKTPYSLTLGADKAAVFASVRDNGRAEAALTALAGILRVMTARFRLADRRLAELFRLGAWQPTTR
jgi:hypothetical protein